MSNLYKWIGYVFVASVTFLAAQAAYADAEVGQAYFSPMVTFIDDDKDRAVDDQVGGGSIAFGGALHEYWNLEIYAHYATLDGFAEQDHFEAGLDLQWVLNRSGRVSPYLLGGIGYMDVQPVGARHDDGGAWSAGAGLYLDVFGSSNTALRAEYRYRRDTALTDTLSDHLFSLGLQIPFGSGQPRIVDTDRDGVADSLDRCPGTPFGTPVDAHGCSDSDGDGVEDGVEIYYDRTDPLDATHFWSDADGDGLRDDVEIALGLNTASADSDGITVHGNALASNAEGMMRLLAEVTFGSGACQGRYLGPSNDLTTTVILGCGELSIGDPTADRVVRDPKKPGCFRDTQIRHKHRVYGVFACEVKRLFR